MESGTITSRWVLTADPLEALVFPLVAILLIAWLVAESIATLATTLAADVDLFPSKTVPTGALVCAVPLALPPEVLT